MLDFWSPDNLRRVSVGFEKAFDDFSKLTKSTGNFPPYNISKIDNNKYVIEFAVAGFGKENLEIDLDNGILTITGKKASPTADEQTYYLFKGIAERAFKTSFSLANTIKIQNAELVNGILKIWLESVAKDKSTKIPINDSGGGNDAESKPQLLNEVPSENPDRQV